MNHIKNCLADRISAISTKVILLIKHDLGPVDAVICLGVTIGRITARQGFNDIQGEEYWKHIQEGIKTGYTIGFETERKAGHLGIPRKPSENPEKN